MKKIFPAPKWKLEKSDGLFFRWINQNPELYEDAWVVDLGFRELELHNHKLR